MATKVFEFSDYKLYMSFRLDDENYGGGRGSRAKLSQFVGCQSAYMAQVLRGSAHFNPEQTEKINEYFLHSEEESDFFHLLVQMARAGTPKLRQRLQRQITRLRESQLLLKNRISVKQSLSIQDQMTYYSSWIYGAVHALVSIPGIKTAEDVSQQLGVSSKIASDAVSFLLSCGIIEEAKGGLRVGTKQIHLSSDSSMISKHHTNWRMKALQTINESASEGLHYSSVISISHSDSERVREILITAIEKAKAIIRNSPEEKVEVFSLDFFGI